MKDFYGNEATNLPEVGEEEIWKVIKDFPKYEVSSFGNIRHIEKKVIRQLQEDKDGYLCLPFYLGVDPETKKKKKKIAKVHRLVCEAFCEPPQTEDENIADHMDRCRKNNYYKNLRWVDRNGNANNKVVSKKKQLSWSKWPILLVNDGKIVQEFSSIINASEVLGMSAKQISSNIRGGRKQFLIGSFVLKSEYMTNLTK